MVSASKLSGKTCEFSKPIPEIQFLSAISSKNCRFTCSVGLSPVHWTKESPTLPFSHGKNYGNGLKDGAYGAEIGSTLW